VSGEEPAAAAGEQAPGARAGIHCLTIPTPFPIGPVNCYLIEDEPLTLVDTGPNSGTALDALERALRKLGHGLEDLELIVLTHQHVDHIGLLEIIVERSGAQVAAFAGLAPWLADYPRSAAADDAWVGEQLLRHGVPGDLAVVLGVVGAAYRPYGSAGALARELVDGDRLELRDRTFEVRHRPGHSPSDLVFWDAQRRILLAGDHLLARVSSNPLIARAPAGARDRGRLPSLQRYIASLRATTELPAELVLAGHGKPILDHVALIEERLRLHDRRARRIVRMLADEPLSAYELALQMWGNAALTQTFLTLSEVLGHLDLLVADGRVAERHDGALSTFEAL
jgi:glyoxylase-like metal-dependent hydrolase (beta-lactamase superfamily II)